MLLLANKDIEKYDKEIQLFENEEGFYELEILTLRKDGSIAYSVPFAENYYEHELAECINDAWAHIRAEEKFKSEHNDFICYRIVHGWTHSTPALIYSLTEFPVFFYDAAKGTVENIEDGGGIDAYENRNGYFCVNPEDYEIALRQIDDHDNRGVER